MIVGTRAKRLKDGRIKNVQCPECGAETDMIYSVYSRYVHMSYIPFFPTKKIVAVECVNCKRTYDLYKLPDPIIKKFQEQELSGPTKHPIWFYSGITITLSILAFAVFMGIQAKKEEKINIVNPKSGDVYRIYISRGHYTSAKVSKVFKDSLYLLSNDMETTNYSGIDGIDTDEHYNQPETVSRKEIEKMYKDNTIYQIDRPE